MLVSDFIAHSAGNAPDRTALVFDNRRFTYGALNSVSFHLASYLAAAGFVSRTLDIELAVATAFCETSDMSTRSADTCGKRPPRRRGCGRLQRATHGCRASTSATVGRRHLALAGTAKCAEVSVEKVVDSVPDSRGDHI